MNIRGYGPNVMAERNIREQLDDDTVDMLLREVENAYGLYHRFLHKKSQIL
jgi:hypothetical protein